MSREIVECSYSVSPVAIDDGFVSDPKKWLTRQAVANGLTTLLAHADDGVIWGQLESGGRLALSHDAFPDVSPPLRAITLQQARLFSEQAELLVWRDGDGGWRTRLLKDDGGPKHDAWCFDETHLQWGDHQEGEADGFTLVAEGQEGLRHAVPLPAAAVPFDLPEKTSDRWHPLRLGVRQYLDRDEDGTLVIVQGRLTGLWAESRKEGSDE